MIAKLPRWNRSARRVPTVACADAQKTMTHSERNDKSKCSARTPSKIHKCPIGNPNAVLRRLFDQSSQAHKRLLGNRSVTRHRKLGKRISALGLIAKLSSVGLSEVTIVTVWAVATSVCQIGSNKKTSSASAKTSAVIACVPSASKPDLHGTRGNCSSKTAMHSIATSSSISDV